MAEIARTATEPATLTWLQDGKPVRGASPTMRVRRKSDSFTTVLDWDAELFTADAVAVTPSVPLAEVSATYAPGLYWWLYDPTFPSNAVAPDIYAITFYADATLATPLGTAEVRVGTVDTLDALPATLASAHGAGAWTTGAVAGDAMTLTAGALTAVQAKIVDDATPFHGASVATILSRADVATSTRAAPGAAMTLQADAITSATIAAGAIGASEAPLLANLDAAMSTRATAAALATAQGNITTILGYTPAAVSAQVAADLAGAHGAGSWVTADISTLATAASLAAVAVDATKARRALWNRRTLSSAGLFTLYADDAATILATASITDKDGAAITLQTGEAARSTALV